MGEQLKIGDRVKATCIVKRRWNEYSITGIGEVFSIKDGVVGVFTENLSPASWWFKIEDIVNMGKVIKNG